MKNIAVYPGSFDPVTFGHLDIMERASKLYDHVYVVIAKNLEKKCLFSVEERVELLKEVTKHIPNITVETTDVLIVEYVRLKGAKAMIRGLRAVSDFEYEMKLSFTNQILANDVETVFLMAKPANSFLSSSQSKEVAKYGGDLSKFVPTCVRIHLEARFPRPTVKELNK